jgi:hypothetical protein
VGGKMNARRHGIPSGTLQSCIGLPGIFARCRLAWGNGHVRLQQCVMWSHSPRWKRKEQMSHN